MTKVKDGFWKQLGSKVGSNDYLLKAAGGYIGVGNSSGDVVPLNNGTKNENLNADMVDGYHLSQITPFVTKRDFNNGTLVKTNILFPGTNISVSEAFLLTVRGNGYGGGIINFEFQGYVYYTSSYTNPQIINSDFIIYSPNSIDKIYTMSIDNKLCFWWARQAFWQGFHIFCTTNTESYQNRVTEVQDVSKPVGLFEQNYTPKLSLTTGNYTSYLDERYYTETEVNNLLSKYLPLSGGWMDTGVQIYFKGLNQSKSTFATIGYRGSLGSVMHHPSSPHQDNGAFYIASNGYNSSNDWGGLAIDNEGVTVFGAGDTGDVFRVLNEDNVSDGAQFYVTKSSGAVVKRSLTASNFVSNVTTGTQPYACTSTTLNTNLNADLLDGIHASGLFTNLSNAGNDLSVTIGGTTKTLTPSYASVSGSCTGNASSSTKLQTSRKLWSQLFDGTADVNGQIDIIINKQNSSTVVPSSSAIMLGSNGAGHTGYHAGIAFNALRYNPYVNHIHAWIGLGPYTTTAAAECYPLVFATNGSTTTGDAPTERMRITPSGNVGISIPNPAYKLEVGGSICGDEIYTNRGGSSTKGGVSLYYNVDPMTYGIAFRGTGTYGIHGFVTSANDWATYLTMSDDLTRGWIFRRGSTNVASIAGNGNMAIGQHLKFSNEAHISTNRSTDYHYGYTFNLGNNAKSIGMYSGPEGEAGGVVISPDGCLIYNSSDCGYNLQVRDKDLGGDLTNIATLTFAIEQSGYYAWSRGGFKKNGSDDSYFLLGGGGHTATSNYSLSTHTHTFNLGSTTITTNGGSYSGITGPFNIYTNASSSNAFAICRGSLEEGVRHWVDDGQYHIDYTNDETSSSIHIRIINTDTESGNKTNTTDYHYYLDCYGTFHTGSNNTGSIGTAGYKWANMYATTFHGSLDGNATSATSATSATQATNLMPENTAHYFRNPNDSAWRGGMIWGSAGNESMSFVVANSGTRFQFVGGSDIASWTSGTWQSANPYLTIYSNGIVTPGSATASGGFIKSGYNDNYVLLAGGGHKALSDFSMAHSHPYLPLAGGTMTGAINLSNTNAKLAFGSLSTSPVTGYKAPSLGSNGVGIYSRYGGSSDEGAIIITEDTCVIYNSADSGWNFQVMDKDLGTDMTNDATRSFGINQNHQAVSLSGFVKSGYNDNYVLLAGGGTKAISEFSSNVSVTNSAPILGKTAATIATIGGTAITASVGDSDKVDGLHFWTGSSLPSSPSSDTIYIII